MVGFLTFNNNILNSRDYVVYICVLMIYLKVLYIFSVVFSKSFLYKRLRKFYIAAIVFSNIKFEINLKLMQHLMYSNFAIKHDSNIQYFLSQYILRSFERYSFLKMIKNIQHFQKIFLIY